MCTSVSIVKGEIEMGLTLTRTNLKNQCSVFQGLLESDIDRNFTLSLKL